MIRRHCPVCWQNVGLPTVSGNIAQHFDSVGRDVCPMTDQPFKMAGFGQRRWQFVREYVRPAEGDPDMTADDAVGRLRMDALEKLVAA